MKQSTILPMDCVREILTFLSPVKDTQGLHKYGYSEIPTYPYITQFTDLVDDAYEVYWRELDYENAMKGIAFDCLGEMYGWPDYEEILPKDKFTGGLLNHYMHWAENQYYGEPVEEEEEEEEEENLHTPTFVDSSDDEDSDGE